MIYDIALGNNIAELIFTIVISKPALTRIPQRKEYLNCSQNIHWSDEVRIHLFEIGVGELDYFLLIALIVNFITD